MLSPEERERQHREREESRRVLFELKAVLGFRASEGERMKRKQLLFSDQGLRWRVASRSLRFFQVQQETIVQPLWLVIDLRVDRKGTDGWSVGGKKMEEMYSLL